MPRSMSPAKQATDLARDLETSEIMRKATLDELAATMQDLDESQERGRQGAHALEHLLAAVAAIRERVRSTLYRCAEPAGTDSAICLHDLPCTRHPDAAANLRQLAAIEDARQRMAEARKAEEKEDSQPRCDVAGCQSCEDSQ